MQVSEEFVSTIKNPKWTETEQHTTVDLVHQILLQMQLQGMREELRGVADNARALAKTC
jgi:hypothetical protein